MRKIEIPGECVPKGRPRFTRSGRVYTPKKTKDYEALIKYTLNSKRVKPTDQPLKLSIIVVKKPLKSWTKQQRENAKLGRLLPAKKPDIDNYVKSVLDGCNGLLFKDDGQIVELHAKKTYGKEPKVIIEYEELA